MAESKWEPDAEAVEAEAREVSARYKAAVGFGVEYASAHANWQDFCRHEARVVLRRQHERESGLIRAMKQAEKWFVQIAGVSDLTLSAFTCAPDYNREWWQKDAIEAVKELRATLAAHAKLDAPKVPTPTGCPCCGAATMFVRGRHPGDDNREVCPTCLLEKVEDMAANATRPVAYKAAVEREEKRA